MIAPPPRSTLFPYTTLFRSAPQEPTFSHATEAMDPEEPVRHRRCRFAPLRQICQRGTHEDRKSTRLNSSHGYISYAVFCLKKKTENRDARMAAVHTIHIHRD